MPPIPPRGILNKAKRVGYAMNFFQQNGWSPHAAQAILGTLMQESGLNPASRGDKVNGVPTSFGIGQWHADRFTNLKRFAAAQGTDWTDFTTQLGFLHHELTAGTERANGARLMQAQDLPSAVRVMYDAWRPAAGPEIEVPRRLALARQIRPTFDPNYVEPVVSPRLRSQGPLQPPMPMEKPQPTTPATPGMMTPGQRVDPNQLTPPPADTSEEMPPEAYSGQSSDIPAPPPPPSSDGQVGSNVLKTLGQIVFPDMASDLRMPELPPVPDPIPTAQESTFVNNWRPVVPRFRERFANLYGRQGQGQDSTG